MKLLIYSGGGFNKLSCVILYPDRYTVMKIVHKHLENSQRCLGSAAFSKIGMHWFVLGATTSQSDLVFWNL